MFACLIEQNIILMKNTRGLKGNEIFIMVASSSKKQEIPEEYGIKLAELKGVSRDVYMFKDYTKNHPKDKVILLHTSKNIENSLLQKKHIMATIKQYFDKMENIVYFLFSGHGNDAGDLMIETVQNSQDGELITLPELISLWKQSKTQKKKDNAHLCILLDSCFSGKWCERIIEQRQSSISVFASCDQYQTSKDIKSGGLLFSTILSVEGDFESNHQLLLKYHHPRFVHKLEKGGKLEKDNLHLLSKSLNNYDKLSGEILSIKERWWDPELYPANGKNKFTDKQGNIYDGEWKNYQRHGYGQMKYKNGQIYKGQWKNHEKQGQGVYILKNIEDGSDAGVFTGEFKNGMPNGEGTYDLGDNWVMKGLWKDWKRHGKGQTRMGDTVIKGIWKQDQLIEQHA